MQANIIDSPHRTAAVAHGAHMLVLSGGNPSKQLPLGALMQRRGDQLAEAARAAFARPGVTLVDNWADARLTDTRYWSADKLHLSALVEIGLVLFVITLGVNAMSRAFIWSLGRQNRPVRRARAAAAPATEPS